MKWFGYPVEIIKAMIDGTMQEVAVVYQWRDGKRRTRWLVPRSCIDGRTLERETLPQNG